MAITEWGTKEWQNDHFPNDLLDSEGDTWGMRWRGMDKMRHRSYLKLIKDDLQNTQPLKILDIGCALCDFTEKAWKLNKDNQFWGMDLSDNAIGWVTQKFPMFSFKTGTIPDIPFDVEFDMVCCLEVICYVNADDRKKTIDNIHLVLAPCGKLLFSGVLDGGRQHHTEKEVIDLIEKEFDIRQIIYNHWSLYRKLMETPLDTFRSRLLVLLRALEMSNEEFQERTSSKGGRFNFKIAKTLRSGNPVSIWLVRAVTQSIKLIISSRLLAVIFHEISKVTRDSKKADEIVVLAVKQ